MKICLINNLYSPWVRGGAEKIVELSAAGLRRLGHEVFVISTAPTGSTTPEVYYLPSLFYNLGRCPFWQRSFWHFWDLFNLINLAKINKIFKEEKPDLVITHNLMGVGFLTPLLLKLTGVRHFHTLHDIQLLHPSGLMFWGQERTIDGFFARAYQAVSRFLLGSPAAVISPSRWLLDEHVRRGFFKKSQKMILPNRFSENCPPPQEQRSKNKNSKFQILYVGQIEKHKGVELLIKAFLLFLEKNGGAAELSVVGDGAMAREAEALAAGHPEIRFLGKKSSEAVLGIMQESDCLAVPSLCYENSPTVIYEAAAAGLPALGARLGGIPELIERFGGVLFEPGDEKDLAEKMARVAAGEKGEGRREEPPAADYAVEIDKLAKNVDVLK